MTQILDQLSPRVKKELALQYLAQGKSMITSAPRAENQEQMNSLDRAKTAAEGLNRLDVRIRVFLLIAQHTMEIPLEPEEPMGYKSHE